MVPLVKKARERGILIQEAERAKLDSLSAGENHQGVAALVSDYHYASLGDILRRAEEKGEAPFVILCDKITDPHNLGAIIRTANCAGAHGVVIPKRNSAVVNSTVEKTSAGAVEFTPVVRVSNLVSAIQELKAAGLWIAGGDMNGEGMYTVDLTGPLGIVIGSEGSGISRLVRENCDFIASIPMAGDISSLNASVAASILMYEAVRQRVSRTLV